jgi:hypothetical protein
MTNSIRVAYIDAPSPMTAGTAWPIAEHQNALLIEKLAGKD